MKKLLQAAGGVVAVLSAIVVLRTATLRSLQPVVQERAELRLDPAVISARLAGAVRIETVSRADSGGVSAASRAALDAYLREEFSLSHRALERVEVGRSGVVYLWRGRLQTLPAVMLAAHLDVVPVDPATAGEWTHAPFSGHIGDGHVWGRGALDDKSSALAILEAVEALVIQQFVPERSLIIAFGYDEEVGGGNGAVQIAQHLERAGVVVDMLVDEGGVINDGSLPVDAPVALVGIAEKGYVSLRLTSAAESGHSSMPPRATAVGILSRAVARLEDSPFAGSLRGPTQQLFAFTAPEMPLLPRTLFANQWLFGPLIERQLDAAPSSAAMLRTTIAPTMLAAGVQDNVLPAHASAVVNLRIYPGETVASVTQRVRDVVADERVSIEPMTEFAMDPSPVSPTDGAAFEALQRTIREVFSDVVTAPYLTLGATDARHYSRLTPNVYRFIPIRVGTDDLPRIHGIDERIGIDGYADAIRFYHRLIRNTTAPPAGGKS